MPSQLEFREVRRPVGDVRVDLPPDPARSMPLWEQAAMVTDDVLTEFRNSGALPGPFRREMYDRYGAYPAYEQVKREARPWAQRWCEAMDRGAEAEHAADW